MDGGVLHRRLFGEPTTLNAVLQSSAPEAQVLQYVQRNLFDFDARLRPRARPGGGAGGVRRTGSTYTITLRPDAVWEDGRPVTSADAVFTIRKIVDPKIPSNVFKPVFEEFASVEALDARRFEVRFTKPYAFRSMAFVLPLLPEHQFAGQNFLKAKQNRAPLSNGPYRFVAWKAQESVELERNASLPRAPRPLRPDRVPHRARTTRRPTGCSWTGELDEDQIDAGTQGPRRPRSGLCRVLPARRVLQPRLQLHRPERPVAALRGRAHRAAR